MSVVVSYHARRFPAFLLLVGERLEQSVQHEQVLQSPIIALNVDVEQ